ncbi:MAG: hypothetical protein Q9195_004991 [Heterodermia aff. obscurata]
MSFLSLDWRNAPSKKVIIDRILTLFNDLGTHGQVSVRLGSSTAKTVVFLTEQDGIDALRRRDKTSQRRVNTVGLCRYWSDLFAVAETLIAMQVDEQALKGRFIACKDVSPKHGQSLVYIRRLIIDLALTIQVHPIALGVKGEGSGQVFIPHNVHIECTVVTNTFAYNERDESPENNSKKWRKTKDLRDGSHSIPEPVLSLQVRIGKSGGRVDAVIVVEHRNVLEVMAEGEHAVKHVILIMTSGQPDSATKEFLHQLSDSPRLKRTPFLYYSDHDTHGIDVFKTLKYGSKQSAWVTDISICPQLTWVGPTYQQYLDVPQAFRQQHIADYKVAHPRASEEEVNQDASKWEKQAKRDMKSKLVPINKKQKEMVRAFETGGWLIHEPVIQDELERMLKEPAQFRFANLAEIDVRYLRQCVETVLVTYCAGRVRVPTQSAAALSTQAQAFANAPSQSQAVTSVQDPSQVLATPQGLPAQETMSADAVLAELADFDMEAVP